MSENTRSDEKPQSQDAAHDCSEPKPVPSLPAPESDLAENYGLGHPGSQASRRERRPYFVR